VQRCVGLWKLLEFLTFGFFLENYLAEVSLLCYESGTMFFSGVSPSTTSNNLQLETTPVVLRGASITSDWVLFNDFCISPTSVSDVVLYQNFSVVWCCR
jgi:hypothetical protein